MRIRTELWLFQHCLGPCVPHSAVFRIHHHRDSLQQPQIKSPTLQGPTLQNPTLQGPTIQNPTLQGPTLQNPTLQGPPLQQPGPLQNHTQSIRNLKSRPLSHRPESIEVSPPVESFQPPRGKQSISFQLLLDSNSQLRQLVKQSALPHIR